MRYGIPGVWIFCGTTPDYHTERDVEERVDYAKMEKVTRLTYLVAMDIGNRPALLAARRPSGDQDARRAQHEGGLAAAGGGEVA